MKKRPLRLLHCIASGDLKGGTEMFMVRLVRALHQLSKPQNIEQMVVTKDTSDAIKQYLEPLGVPVKAVSQRKRSLISAYKIHRVFKAFKPDIAMSWLPRACQRLPHGPWVKLAQVTWHQGMGCYEKADYLLVPSPGLKTYMARQTDKPIYVLPHFTDHMRDYEKNDFSKPLQGPPVILGLGRFDDVKGFDVAIRSMAYIRDAHLWLVGEGAAKPALEALILKEKLNDRVKLFPWTQDIAVYLDKASVLVVPSRQEALGLIILEAWQQGVPVVATKTDGPLYLIDDGINGLLVEKESPEGLGRAVQDILSNTKLAQQLAEQGKAKLENNFTAIKTVEAYRDLFRQVLDGG